VRKESRTSAPEIDLQLLARIREGDRAAFEQLYRL
jgi:hypothetical protein